MKTLQKKPKILYILNGSHLCKFSYDELTQLIFVTQVNWPQGITLG